MIDLSALKALGSRDDEIGRLTDRELSPMFRLLLRARLSVALLASIFTVLLGVYDQALWKTALAAAASVMLLVLSARDRRHFDTQGLPPRKSAEILGSVMTMHMVLITLTGGIHSPLVVILPVMTFAIGVTVGRPRPVAVPLAIAITFVWLVTMDDFGNYALIPSSFARVLPQLGGPAFGLTMAVILSLVMSFTSLFGLLIRGAVERGVVGAREARAETLATMRDRNRELWHLSGAVAHELKNPLASVQGLAGLLARKMEAGTKEAERMAVLVEEVGRMGSIIQEFLNFSRPLTEMTRRDTSPRTLVDKAMALHGPLADAAGVKLEPEPTAMGLLSCDPRKLSQVLSNLILNAIDASPRGGTVTLRVGDAGEDGVCFEVLDEGPGIDDEIRRLLFRPGATTKPSGSGIGLAVARSIAEQHGGTLQLRDRPEGGCRATLEVPRHPPTPDAPETKETA